MNVFEYFSGLVEAALNEMTTNGSLKDGLSFANVTVEPPRDPSHGDIATNAALVLSKQASMNPRALATILAERLETLAEVDTVDIAGPGFINLRVDATFWQARVAEMLALGEAYGDSDMGAAKPYNVEYVSANPTGPMHVGHTRGAVFGDALANLLAKVGYNVAREYYINDAGSQIDVLAKSAYLRYREAHGERIQIPEGLYPGDYLVGLGRHLKTKYGDRWMNGSSEGDWMPIIRSEATDAMMDLIRDDLEALGIKQDVFFSEKTLHESGRIKELLDVLEERGVVYRGVLEPPKGMKPDEWEPREQLLFRATDFGDDIDRPLQKSNGDYTYFAADIAYHYDKYVRGFHHMVNVFGADHSGYVKRLVAGVKAFNEDGKLDVRLCQLVHLFRNGEQVKMSKRSGTFITLREVVDEVGKDVVRFIMLTRKNDAPLDFDYAKVVEQSKDNPVFYVQYANARINSVIRNRAPEMMPGLDVSDKALMQADMAELSSVSELNIIKRCAEWPRVVEAAAQAKEPHRIAFYLYDLASDFHALWNQGNVDSGLRFVVEGKEALSLARLALIRSVAIVLASGLNVLGVKPVEEMR